MDRGVFTVSVKWHAALVPFIVTSRRETHCIKKSTAIKSLYSKYRNRHLARFFVTEITKMKMSLRLHVILPNYSYIPQTYHFYRGTS